MERLSAVLFVLVGLVNFAPVIGIVSASRVQSLYGIDLGDPNLIILLRHRAALFGIVGALVIAAAFYTPLRPIGFTAGMISMLSFVAVAYLVGGYNEELRRVVLIDIVAIVLLVAAWVTHSSAGTNPGTG